MTQINLLLELRSKIKSKKPDFIRQDNPKRMKVNSKWRKPKGVHSKIRHHFKGRRKMPSPGYKSPREAKGLHQSGLRIVNISSVGDLKNLNKGEDGIIISKNVGMKKKLEILKKSKEMEISTLNSNLDDQIKKIENFIDSKKKKDVPKAKDKKDTKEHPKEIKETKDELTDEQKKEAEKLEKDKLLTKKV